MNDFGTFIIALTVGIIGSWLLYVLLKALLSPLLQLIRLKRGEKSFKKTKSQFSQFDNELEKGNYKKATVVLKKHFTIKIPKSTAEYSFLKQFYDEYLTKLLILSGEMNIKDSSQTTLESLVIERLELIEIYLKINAAYDNVKVKRKDANKPIPEWSKEEFENKIKNVKEELVRNESEMKKIATKIFELLNDGPKKADSNENQITYH